MVKLIKYCIQLALCIFFKLNILAQTPVINSFYPTSGTVGTIVTIIGSNFNTDTFSNIVYFGSVKASVLTADTNILTVKVPSGATFVPITVTTSNKLTAYSTHPFIITFPENTQQLSSNSFIRGFDYSTGSGPRSVMLKDLNGDNKSDFIVANTISNTVSILKNISTDSLIMFWPKIDLNTYTFPIKVTSGDLDGDGRLDLVVTNFNSGDTSSIYIYKNISTADSILFAPKIDYISGHGSIGTAIGDFDGDGKSDILTISGNSAFFSIFKNTSTQGIISFAPKIDFHFFRGDNVAIADIDGDKKTDIVISNSGENKVYIFKNTSSLNSLSFASGPNYIVGAYPSELVLSDFNNDNKIDIAVLNFSGSSFSVLRNSSANEIISFARQSDVSTITNPSTIVAGDLDGDSKPDLIIGTNTSGFCYIYKNNSFSSGTISFTQNISYLITGSHVSSAIGDLNGDGRQDIAVSSSSRNTTFKNKMEQVNIVNLCPPFSNTTIRADALGSFYQWQVKTDSVFVNISDNEFYVNSNSSNLTLNGIPSAWHGYQYRCYYNGNYSDAFKLVFLNSWIGSVNSEWENPANWSCGTSPDENTDVIINSGTLVLNSNATIRSLKLNPNVIFTINSGYTLTIKH